jgi:hypothetical protein
MLERYFTARTTLRRLRFGPSGPYIDRFAAVLHLRHDRLAGDARHSVGIVVAQPQ